MVVEKNFVVPPAELGWGSRPRELTMSSLTRGVAVAVSAITGTLGRTRVCFNQRSSL